MLFKFKIIVKKYEKICKKLIAGPLSKGGEKGAFFEQRKGACLCNSTEHFINAIRFHEGWPKSS